MQVVDHVLREEIRSRIRLWEKIRSDSITGITTSDVQRYGINTEENIFAIRWLSSGQDNQNKIPVIVSLTCSESLKDDLLSDEYFLYQPLSKNENEMKAIRVNCDYELPVFIAVPKASNQNIWEIRMGWIDCIGENTRLVLFRFSEKPDHEHCDIACFSLFEERNDKETTTICRSIQPRFRFQVFQRYGPKCALCGINILSLLQAAHLCPYSERGTNDPRNGLVLCLNHHAAFDKQLFGIEPSTLRVECANELHSYALGIVFSDLSHLIKLPHIDAVQWSWNRYMQHSKAR